MFYTQHKCKTRSRSLYLRLHIPIKYSAEPAALYFGLVSQERSTVSSFSPCPGGKYHILKGNIYTNIKHSWTLSFMKNLKSFYLFFPPEILGLKVLSCTFSICSTIAGIHVLWGARAKGWLVGAQPARLYINMALESRVLRKNIRISTGFWARINLQYIMGGMWRMTSDFFVFCVKPKPINDPPVDTECVSSCSFQLCCLFQNYSKGPDPANKLPFVDIWIHAKLLPNPETLSRHKGSWTFTLNRTEGYMGEEHCQPVSRPSNELSKIFFLLHVIFVIMWNIIFFLNNFCIEDILQQALLWNHLQLQAEFPILCGQWTW